MIVHLNKTALPGVPLAPLSLESVILHADAIKGINGDISAGRKSASSLLVEYHQKMADIIFESATRAKSGKTREQIVSLLSAKTAFDVFFAVINLSGFEECEDGESGE